MKKKIKTLTMWFAFTVLLIASIILLCSNKNNGSISKNLDIEIQSNGNIKVIENAKYNITKDSSEIMLKFIGKQMEKFSSGYDSENFRKNIISINLVIKQGEHLEKIKYRQNNEKNSDDFKLKKYSDGYGIDIGHTFDKGQVDVTFEYILKNNVIKYKDKSELYMELLNKENMYDIDNIKVSVDLSMAMALNGKSFAYEYTENNIAKIEETPNNGIFEYSDIKAGDILGIDVLFDSVPTLIGYADGSNIDLLLSENVEKFYEIKFTKNVINVLFFVIIVLLFAYWIYLLIKYDFNKVTNKSYPTYEQIVENVNPVIASCIVNERGINNNDVIAILMSLVYKKVLTVKSLKVSEYENIRMDTENKYSVGSAKYVYLFQKDKLYNVRYKRLDDIHKQVLDIFFFDNSDKFILHERLKDIDENAIAIIKKENLQKYVDDKLSDMGLNIKPPRYISVINKVIFLLTCIFLVFSIGFNIFGIMEIQNNFVHNIYLNNLVNIDIYLKAIISPIIYMIFVIITILVLIKYFYHIILLVNRNSRLTLKYIEKETNNFKITSYMNTISNTTRIAMKIVVITSIISILIYMFIPIIDIFIWGIAMSFALCILITTKYMSKHMNKLDKLYLGINIYQDKIIDGSLLEEKSPKDKEAWNDYLAYSVAFGISNLRNYVEHIKGEEKLALCRYIKNKEIYMTLLEIFLK